MSLDEPTPCIPTQAQRLAMRTRPAGQPVMFQQWWDLLFLHWEYSAKEIQKTLPAGLFVDSYDGKAWLGVVPFFMRNIRPRFLPAVPGISHFMELNLRTYVHDRAGVPGVWFYSLDANQWLAVRLARRFFHLPYQHARMTSSRTAGSSIRYQSTRIGCEPGLGTSNFEYAPSTALLPVAPGSLEFFLIERYRLYSSGPGGLRRGAVFHPPYPPQKVEGAVGDERLLALNGFTPTGRPPDHVVMSPGVDVTVFPLVKV